MRIDGENVQPIVHYSQGICVNALYQELATKGLVGWGSAALQLDHCLKDSANSSTSQGACMPPKVQVALER